jgi:type I restriction enzyme, S subunit
MERYEKYKDSGFDWIGEIPENWEVKKIKYLIEDHSGNGFPNSEQGKNGLEFPFYKVSDINQNTMFVDRANNYVSAETVEKNKWNIVPKNSVIAAKIGEALRKNHRKISIKDCLIDNNCIGLEPKGIDYKFNFYFQSLIDFDWFVNPGAVPSLSVEKYKQFKVVVPKDVKEQTAIANYLDHKTAEIDQLIAQKKKLLELYKEEKIAIINQAVTKGINPDVRLKDTGIDWLGEIPEHWEVKKLKYVVDLITGKSNGDLQKVGLENIESNSGNFIDTNSEFQGDGIKFIIGDILYGKLRPYLAKVLKCEFEGAAVGDFFVLRTKENYLSEFIKFRLLSTSFTEISNSSTYGAKMPRVNWEFMAHLYFALPNKVEQTIAVQYIETETAKINIKAEKTKKLIELLGDYKQSLISEVVTGKVKVV